MSTRELPSAVTDICQTFVGRLKEILNTKLYGVYLYGALVFPDSGPVQDIDCHVILAKPLIDEERESIFRLHKKLAHRYPPLGGELDAYFILFEDAQATSPPRHQLRAEIVDTAWALHCAHIRAGYYVSLYGPAPTEIFPAASWQEIAAALDHELRFIEKNLQYPAYCVLNLCRIVYSFQKRDVVVSKRFSGDWAREQFPNWQHLIEAATRSYDENQLPEDKALLKAEVGHFLDFASRRIHEARNLPTNNQSSLLS